MEAARIVSLGVVSIAAVSDLRSRRIPNLVTFGAAIAGVVFHVWTSAGSGFLFSVGGWAVGVGVFLPMFLLRGMGAGDVKLLAAVGAWLGPVGVMWAALFTTFAGGVLALIVGSISGYTGRALTNLWVLLGIWRTTGIQPVEGLTIADAPGPRLPYGVAIAAGTLAAVWFK
jgi:prepilin peptidase CpaA